MIHVNYYCFDKTTKMFVKVYNFVFKLQSFICFHRNICIFCYQFNKIRQGEKTTYKNVLKKNENF